MSRNFDKNKRRPSVGGKRVASSRGAKPDGRGARAGSPNRGEELRDSQKEPASSPVLSPEGWLIRDGGSARDDAPKPAGGSGSSARIIPIQVTPHADRAPSEEAPEPAVSQTPVTDNAETEVSQDDGVAPLTSSQALVAFAAASARAVPAQKEGREPSRKWFGGLADDDKDARDDQAVSSGRPAGCAPARPSEGGAVPPRRKRRAALANLPLITEDDRDREVRAAEAAGSAPEGAESGEGACESSTGPVRDGDSASHRGQEDPRGGTSAAEGAHAKPSADDAGSGEDSPFRDAPVADEAGEGAADQESEHDSAGTERPKRPSVPAAKLPARKRLSPAVDMKKVGIAFGAIAAAALLAVLVACFGFGFHLNKSIVLENPELDEVLTPVQDRNQPFYTLFAVEYSRTSRYYEGPELLALVRTDPVNNTATIVSVPWNTEVSLTDGKYHPVSEAQVIGGDAYLVSSVSELLDVDIAHFIRTDDTGLAHIVDRLGGIEVETDQLSQDSAEEGASGAKQALNGEDAAAFARSEGPETSVHQRSWNQIAVVSALLEKAVGEYGLEFVGTAGSLKNDFKTDMSVAALRSSFGALAGKEGYTTYAEVLPGEIDEMSGEDGYFRDKKATRLMMAAISESGDPSKRDEMGLDKASVFIEVQNGTEINGGANTLRRTLREAGWNVSFIGNNTDTDTPKTLILYNEPEAKAAAEAIAADLGFGTVTQAGEEYQFGTDILVVLGLDGKDYVSNNQAEE